MDPLAILGISFQVFSGCITAWQLILEAHDFPKKYEHLRLRLELEQYKLLDWWQASDLVKTVPALDDELLDQKRQAAVRWLNHISALLEDLGGLKKRYGLVLEGLADDDGGQCNTDRAVTLSEAPVREGRLALPAASTPGSSRGRREALRQKCIAYAAPLKAYPKRMRWALFDGSKFEQLVSDIASITNGMLLLLEIEERQKHHRLQEDMFLEVLQVRNDLGVLVDLVKSIQLAPSSSSSSSRPVPGALPVRSFTLSSPPRQIEAEPLQSLERLARTKAQALALEQGFAEQAGFAGEIGIELPASTKLEWSTLELTSLQDDRDSLSSSMTAGVYDSKAVWVEWKQYDATNAALPVSYIEDRVARLTMLLKAPGKPKDLHLPVALGYVHDPSLSRFGFVFASRASAAAPSIPRSLYARLQDCLKPSLSMRVAMARRLATSIMYLHASNWLHKGLRSGNILFPTEAAENDWFAFWLSGFEFSRPAGPDQVTELPSDNREHDLYRHPDVQFDVPRDGEYGFKRQHDVYSLGLLLVEIGVWQPIHQFLGVSLNRLITRPVIRQVRTRMLERNSLAMVESESGARFTEAVELCLSVGDDEYPGEQPAENGESSLGGNAESTLRKAVRVLEGISI